MTAPAAPVIHVHTLGTAVRVHWPAVAGAATYDVYAGSATGPTSTVLTGLTSPEGTYVPATEPTYVRVKAINIGAEASAYSNEVLAYNPTAGQRIITHDPFGAKDRRDY